jgi:hypothetical protein
VFGKKGKGEQGAGEASTDRGPAPGGGGTFLERQRRDNDEGAALESKGTATTAIVSAVQVVDEYHGPDYEPMDFTHPPQELAVTADLATGDGQSFTATFPLFLDEIGDPPTIGEQINVVFDSSDHTRVRAKVAWRQQPGGGPSGVLWRVPATCPNCGAPVDQSTQSMAAHPTCTQCNEPLPCEPAA